MSETIKLEYAPNKYVEIKVHESSRGGMGLGGNSDSKKKDPISNVAYEKALNTMIDFLNTTGEKIKSEVNRVSVENMTIGVGISIGAEGKFFIANCTTETTLNVSLTIKGDG